MPALPSAFLTPGTCLLSSFSGTMSGDQAYADLYMAQKAVFPGIGSEEAEGSLPAVPALGDSEHAVIKRTAIATTTLKQLRYIPLPPSQQVSSESFYSPVTY